MGIVLYQLLAQEFFKDFYVVAGHKGLSREVQGVVVMDGPDSYRWTKGRELVMTSGYVLAKEPYCLERSFEEGAGQLISGLMIKRRRHLETIPDHLIELFDRHDVPLISMPYEIAFMDVINQVNISVMNQGFKPYLKLKNENAYMENRENYLAAKGKREKEISKMIKNYQ